MLIRIFQKTSGGSELEEGLVLSKSLLCKCYKTEYLTTSLLVRPSNISAESDSSGISEDDSDPWYLDDTCGFDGFFALFSDTAENAAIVCATNDFS